MNSCLLNFPFSFIKIIFVINRFCCQKLDITQTQLILRCTFCSSLSIAQLYVLKYQFFATKSQLSVFKMSILSNTSALPLIEHLLSQQSAHDRWFIKAFLEWQQYFQVMLMFAVIIGDCTFACVFCQHCLYSLISPIELNNDMVYSENNMPLSREVYFLRLFILVTLLLLLPDFSVSHYFKS